MERTWKSRTTRGAGQLTLRSLSLILFGVFVVLSCLARVDGIRFEIDPHEEQCLREELRPNVLVKGQYSSSYFPGMRLRFRVYIRFHPSWLLSAPSPQVNDPTGEMVYEHEDNGAHKNKFSFTTEGGGEFAFCFQDRLDAGECRTSFLSVPFLIRLSICRVHEASYGICASG